jgi:glycerol-3-phosphate acyltransferase PlsY
VFSFICAGLLGYFLGSLPTAFLLVHWKSKLDIRSAGSGNVGTLNSYQVTGSYLVGAAVLVLDAAKGIAAVALSGVLPEHDFARQACAGVLSILGHNFPLWLRFRGGRGLATSACVVAMFSWQLVPVWGLLWSVSYLALREVNPANAVASFLMPFLVAAAPSALFARLTAGGIQQGEFTLFIACAMVVVLVKHLKPVRAYIQERRGKGSRRRHTGGSEKP